MPQLLRTRSPSIEVRSSATSAQTATDCATRSSTSSCTRSRTTSASATSGSGRWAATDGAPVREAVGVYESERALGITVRTGHSVVVLGYLGEPFHRLGARGVAVNDASLTAVGVGLARRAQSRPGTATDWHVRWTGRTIVWHAAGAIGALGLFLGL